MRTETTSYAFDKTFSRIHNHLEYGRISYKTGTIFTEYGVVCIYQQGYGEKDQEYIALDMVFNGRHHIRRIYDKIYTDIGISRKANEFAREIAENNH